MLQLYHYAVPCEWKGFIVGLLVYVVSYSVNVRVNLNHAKLTYSRKKLYAVTQNEKCNLMVHIAKRNSRKWKNKMFDCLLTVYEYSGLTPRCTDTASQGCLSVCHFRQARFSIEVFSNPSDSIIDEVVRLSLKIL